MKSHLSLLSLYRTLGLSVGLKVLATASTFAVSVVLARTLGIQEYGVYAFWLSVLMLLLTPLQTGMSHLIVREGSIALEHGPRAVVSLARWAVKWVLVVSPLVIILGAVVICICGESISPFGNASTFYAGALLVVFVPLTAVVGSSVRALGGANWGQFPDRNMRPMALLLLLTATMAWPLMGPYWNASMAMALHSAASVIALISSIFILKRHVFLNRGSANADFAPRPGGPLLKGAGSFALLAGLQLLNASIGILLIGFLGTDSEVGQFRVAAQLAGLTSFGLAAANPALHARFAKLIDNADFVALQQVVSAGVRLSLLVAIPPIAILIFAPRLTLGLLFGAQYEIATETLQILLAGQVFNVVFGPVAALLNMGGYQRTTVYVMGAAVVLNAFVSVLLWPMYGVPSVAIGTCAGFLFWNAVLWANVRRRIGVDSSIWKFGG